MDNFPGPLWFCQADNGAAARLFTSGIDRLHGHLLRVPHGDAVLAALSARIAEARTPRGQARGFIAGSRARQYVPQQRSRG